MKINFKNNKLFFIFVLLLNIFGIFFIRDVFAVGELIDIDIEARSKHYSGNLSDSDSSFIVVDFDGGNQEGDPYSFKIYANNTVIYSSGTGNNADHSSTKNNNRINVSKLFKEKNISGNVVLGVRVDTKGTNGNIVTGSLQTFAEINVEEHKDFTLLSASTNANTTRNYYGDVPSLLKRTISFEISEGTFKDDAEFYIYLNDKQIYKETGASIIGSGSCDLDIWVNAEGSYNITYKLTDGRKTSTGNLLPGSYPFVKYVQPYVNAWLTGDIAGIYYTGSDDSGKEPILSSAFYQGSFPDAKLIIYANGDKIYEGSNLELTMSLKDKINGAYLDGTYTFEYEVISSDFSIPRTAFESNKKFEIYKPVKISNVVSNLSTIRNYYGDDLPSSLNKEISFSVEKGSIYTTLKVFLNDDIIYHRYGSDIEGNHTINLDSLISSDGSYTITYSLMDDYKFSKHDLISGSFPFVKFDEPSASLELTGDINNVYYTGNVDTDKKPYLTGSFSKGSFTDAKLIIYANGDKIYEGSNTSINKSLAEMMNTSYYLDGVYTFEYELVSTDYSLPRTTFAVDKVFKRNSIPVVSGNISSTGSNRYFYGENIPNEDRVKLNINVSDDLFLTNSSVLKIYLDDTVVKTYSGTDMLNNNEIDLSSIVTTSGNHSFYYELTDGIVSVSKKQIDTTKNFRTFIVATLTATFTEPINGNYYTNYVKNSYIPKVSLNFEENDNIGASYQLFADGNLITGNAETEDITLTLSNMFNGIYFDGNVRFTSVISSGTSQEIDITKKFIKNDKPQISGISVVSSKGSTYLFGDDNVTDSLKTDLSYVITDNVQLDEASNNFKLKIVNGSASYDPVVFEGTGVNVLGSKTFNLSKIITTENNYKFSFVLDDGIGPEVIDTSFYSNTFAFQKYNLPKVNSSSIYSLLSGGINYTGYVADSNISKFDIDIYPYGYNTVTNYKVYIGKTENSKTLLTSVDVSNNMDLSTSVDLSKYKQNDDFLDGQYSFYYEINFAENPGVPVVGELTNLKNTAFVKNNAAYLTNVLLKGADDGFYYTKDVRPSLRTTLGYTVNDSDNFNKLKVSVYEDNNSNNIYDTGDVIVSQLSTSQGSSSLGDKLYDFTTENLYHNNETKTLKYMIEDGIGDKIDDASTLIGSYTFYSNTKPSIQDNNLEKNVEMDHLFGDNFTIYYGEVASNHQASLKFNLNELQGTVKAYFGDKTNPTRKEILLQNDGTKFTSNLSQLVLNEDGKYAITICLDDGIADVQYFYLNNNKNVDVTTVSHSEAADKGYKFPVYENFKPVVNTSKTILNIPSINSGIIYTHDVRDNRRTKLSIKIDDAIYVTTDLYKVAIGNNTNVSFYENLTKNSALATYDLAYTNLDGTQDLYLILDDGIADVQYVNLAGDVVDPTVSAGKNSLNFVENIAPEFISNPSISNITNNKIFYGDVNVPERISSLTFSASEDCNYSIINEYAFSVDKYYQNTIGTGILDNGTGIYSAGNTVSYNLTEKDYDRFTNNKFPVIVVLDDDIADIVTKSTNSYEYVRNTRPVLNGSIDYGTNKEGTKNYSSIFVSLDNSAVISQLLNLTLTETDGGIKVDNYTYKLNQSGNNGNPIDTKVSNNMAVPTFDLSAYGKSSLFDVGTTNIEVIYTDGIWDSSIANDNFVIENVKFGKAGKPTASASLTGDYVTDVAPDRTFIFDMNMDERYAAGNCYKGVDFTIQPASANTEIELTDVHIEYTMNDLADDKSENGWTVLTGTDKRTSLFSVNDFLNESIVTKNWLNNTGNDNKHVRFRVKVVDELDQVLYLNINESDNFYLAREFAPGSPSKFLMYLGDSNTPSSDYTLEVDKTYRFEWTKPSDTNISQGDDIVKYIFTYSVNGNSTTIECDPQNLDGNLAGSLQWLCEQEGETIFSISSIDKFGRISRVKTIEKSGLINTPPNEINRDSIESTYNTNELKGINYLKRYNSKNYETEYTLSWINAGDIDSANSDDYVAQWKVEYSPNADDWYELKYVTNSSKIPEGERVSVNYTLPATYTVLDDATQIYFRVTAIDNRRTEGVPSESTDAYIYTSDNKEPIWSNLDDLSFNSPEGYPVSLNAMISDDSEIAYVQVNNEDIPFDKTSTGAKFDFTTFKNGTYRFSIMDIYSNLYATSQTITGIDSIPPTVEIIPEESQYTNRAYNLKVLAKDTLTGIKKVYIEYTDLNGRVSYYESAGEFAIGAKEVTYKYLIEAPGSYKVKVVDRADNETIKTINIDNINMNVPEVDFSQPEDLQNQQSKITLKATVKGTNIKSTLGTWSVLQTSTIKNYGEIKSTSVDGTTATLDVFENGKLRVRFTDIFGNESPILTIDVNNILDGNIENQVQYLMLESDYKANYTGTPERVLVDGTAYVKWNNKETTSCQLYGHVKISADFKGLQYAWLDQDRSNIKNATYFSSYGDNSKADEVLFKFTTGKQSLYIIDLFGHFTQVLLTINGYVAPPPCEINYEVLTKSATADGVDVFFEINSGIFVDNGFYMVTVDGVTKNLFEEFVWGKLIDDKFVPDNSYRGKSFKYTFTENGALKVWGQSTLDETMFESIIVNITNIDKSVPIVTVNNYEKDIPQADKLTISANTNAMFISLEELKEQLVGLGYGLLEEELNSYKVSPDGKTAQITLTHNVSGIFFYAKNEAGTIGNCENIEINNIYKSNLEMDLWVFFEDGRSISYEEYLLLEDKSSAGVVTVNAVSSNTALDSEGNYILRRFDPEENPGCKIIDSPYIEGGNMVTATYTFTEAGSYTFILRDEYTGMLSKTVTIGDVSIDEDLPEIYISTENIKGDNVPYVVAVKVTASVSSEGAYFLDDEEKVTEKTYITKTITENGTYKFAIKDRYGRKVEKTIIVDSIFDTNTKPSISVSYDEGFTNKSLTVVATVSNGKFINLPNGWLTISQVNGGPVKIQKVFDRNEENILTAVNFYENSDSISIKNVNISNIDKESPKDPSIESNITKDGLLTIEIVDNGDLGTSGTKQFSYEIYSDSTNYTQDGVVLLGGIVDINSSDRNYRDAEYIIKIVSEDNAGNISEPSFKTFYCDNSLVKDFMSTYNTIITSSNIEDMKDFYIELVDEAKENIDFYKNDVQKAFVSEKCDLLYKVLETGNSEEVILISKIEDWLKQLAKNPSDTSFVPELEAAINSLEDEELKAQYNAQLTVLLNNANIINLKRTAPSTFNYSKDGYIINPLSGVVYYNNIEGHFTIDGDFERGIDFNDYYYLDGNKISLDLTFKTFIDTKGNVFDCSTGLVNGIKYYDAFGFFIEHCLDSGFYDSLGRWYELAKKKEYTVMFVDYDGSVLDTQQVIEGEGAVAPETPIREGYIFVKWDKSFDVITSNLTIMAIYEKEEVDIPEITPGPSVTSIPSITPTEKPSNTPTPTMKPTVIPTIAPSGIPVSEIILNKISVVMYLNDSVFLTATIKPENATNKVLTWKSSNSNVATVVDGVIVPLSAGTTEITVTSSNNITAKCIVKVLSKDLGTDNDENIYIPPSDKYPTIGDILTPTPSGPSLDYSPAPNYWTGYLGSTMVGLTTETNYNSANLRGFYREGLSTLLYNGSGSIDISNKKDSKVNLGFKTSNYAVIMNSVDVNATYNITGFGLNDNGQLSINGTGGLGRNSYLVVFAPYSTTTRIAKDGANISCDYDYDLQGYKVYNPSAGTYTVTSLSSPSVPDTPSVPSNDIAGIYGFVTNTYGNPILYKELIKMAYNALNRDNGGELFSSIDKNLEIYREASILQKYGVISNITQDINSPISGRDAYDILYMTLSQINPSSISYNISSFEYLSTISYEDVKNMITSIVQ